MTLQIILGISAIQGINLSDLPSPALVEDLVKSHDVTAYTLALKDTKQMLLKFSNCKEEDKARLLKSWWQTATAKHMAFSKSAPVERSKWRSYQISAEMNRVDLTKVDLLLVGHGRQPFFHTEEWLYQLYGVELGKPFTISDRPSIPEMFRGPKAISWERGAPSFDWFFKDEAATVSSWIDRDGKDPQPKPMTPSIMFRKPLGP